MFTSIIVLLPLLVQAADYQPDKVLDYKTIDDTVLKLHLFQPDDHQLSDLRPAIVFFFGGGWSGGSPKQFYEQANHFSKLGIVAISAEYRVKRRNDTTPFEAVKDAKSAIRWVRSHAQELGVDPDRIVASGGSAGGHIAATTGVIEYYEEAGEDRSVSSAPNAMILFNPVLDTTENGYGLRKVGEDRKTEISPNHHIHPGVVPTLVLHGTADTTVPFENAESFCRQMKDMGNECTLVPFEGQNHGFFNGIFFRPKTKDLTPYEQSMKESISFLRKLGYL